MAAHGVYHGKNKVSSDGLQLGRSTSSHDTFHFFWFVPTAFDVLLLNIQCWNIYVSIEIFNNFLFEVLTWKYSVTMFVFAEFVFVRQDLPFVYFWFSYTSCPGVDNISFFIALIYVSAVLFTLSRLTQSLMKMFHILTELARDTNMQYIDFPWK